jgi:hypothetical protein
VVLAAAGFDDVEGGVDDGRKRSRASEAEMRDDGAVPDKGLLHAVTGAVVRVEAEDMLVVRGGVAKSEVGDEIVLVEWRQQCSVLCRQCSVLSRTGSARLFQLRASSARRTSFSPSTHCTSWKETNSEDGEQEDWQNPTCPLCLLSPPKLSLLLLLSFPSAATL